MINLSAQTFSSSKTPIGATVATLTLLNQSLVAEPADYMLNKGAAGVFKLSGSTLVTLAVIPPGTYSIRVRAVGTTISWKETAYFPITVTA
jgi:hypothetical protein